MSSRSISTPRHRRMTLSSIPTSSSRANGNSGRPPSSSSDIPKPNNHRRVPKARVSMIPRVGRENSVPSPTGSVKSNKSTISSRRKSLIPPRRQSLAPSTSTRSDPRPLNDRSFQQDAIKKLYSFLQNNGYEYPVTLKSLTRPSAKDFSNICTFLLRQVDPDFGRGTLRFEDEVALNFRCLGYPISVSKTALVAAGSPHTWPSLLSALVWLTDHVKLATPAIDPLEDHQTFESIPELEKNSEQACFYHMKVAYEAFMRNEMETVEQFKLRLEDHFQQDNAILEQWVDRVTDINATIVERMFELGQHDEDLPKYQEKKAGYLNDLEQFQDLIRQMTEHKTSLEEQVTQRSEELGQVNQKLDRLTTHIQNLQQSIQEQEFSVDDMHRLESELKGLKEATERVDAQTAIHRENLNIAEAELEAVSQQLDATVCEYNQYRGNLSKAHWNKKQLDQEHVVGFDVATVLEEATQQQTALVQQVEDAKTQYQDLLDEQNRENDAHAEAEAKLQIVQEKHQKLVQSLQEEQKAHEAKLAVRHREVENLEAKIASLRDPVQLEEQMAAYDRQIAELEALKLEHEETSRARKNAVLTEISQACEAMAAFESEYSETVQRVRAYWQEHLDIVEHKLP